MTFDHVPWRINKIAELAAQSSLDAHGHFVEPADAWDFIREAFRDDPQVTGGLPDAMPRQFPHDYRRHCLILAGRVS